MKLFNDWLDGKGYAAISVIGLLFIVIFLLFTIGIQNNHRQHNSWERQCVEMGGTIVPYTQEADHETYRCVLLGE